MYRSVPQLFVDVRKYGKSEFTLSQSKSNHLINIAITLLHCLNAKILNNGFKSMSNKYEMFCFGGIFASIMLITPNGMQNKAHGHHILGF